MNSPDLLGCICLLDDTCIRNCRTKENKAYKSDPDSTLVEIICDDGMNEPSNLAWQRMEHEEDKRPNQEIVGVEAWSNLLLRLWFKRIQGTKRLLDESTTLEPACQVTIHGTQKGIAVWFGPDDERNTAERLKEPHTTPRAQLAALIRAIDLAPVDEPLHVFSNAEYCVLGVNDRLEGWTRAKFVGLANADLWQRIHERLRMRTL
jgi:hypothetical protein